MALSVRDTVGARETLFVSTCWTLIAEAGGPESDAQTNRALTELCAIYWRPLFLFLRRQGYTSHDAQDLTQGFFADLIEKRFFVRAEVEKGRFRSFLLGAMKYFLANRRDLEQAQKRGRGIRFVAWSDIAEHELDKVAARSYHLAPEEIYAREWAVTLLRRVSLLLEQECRVAGKAQLFRALKDCVAPGGAGAPPYDELALQLSRSTTSLRQDVFRFRQRYRAILREQVRQTVATDEEIDEELRYLRSVMAR